MNPLRHRHLAFGRAALAALALAAAACGGAKTETEAPVRKETAADEVLRIGERWKSRTLDKGILSAPSEISVFRETRISRLELSEETATETLVIGEDVELRNGMAVSCSTEISHPVEIRWGRKQGAAAVELTRPAVSARRDCNGPHPNPTISEPPRRALFVLRSDQLVAVEPPLDNRTYLPD